MEKNYLPLDDQHNVLALLRKGYSFIEIGNKIVYTKNDHLPVAPVAVLEAIPHEVPLVDKDYLLLSDLLKGSKPARLVVEGSYF